ncbi:MAG: diaminopimelate decarboxylase [Clostridiales bacterium]|nr:diaminopimelate decarboxylase [Clostridiales bacterium]MBR6700388.1 diaminopimelate decarboxylase [Bacillota bacterium]
MREIEVNRDGHLVFGGADTVKLAEEYGTPLYVVDENYIVERCREIKSAFMDKYPNATAVYASKALQTIDVCRIVTREGLGLDTVSGGEIYAALKAGADPQKMVFHGNNKTKEEIKFALENNIGRFVVDNLYELVLVNKTAAELEKTASIQIRITPGVDSHTHKFISTGNIDSKFGISLKKEDRNEVIKYALDAANIDLKGFHFHVGSQLMDNEAHLMAMDIILGLVKDVREELGFVTKELNLGGGFGVRYVDGEETVRLEDFTDGMMGKINRFCEENGFELPMVYIEPGRWIVGNAGITLYTVGSIKTIPDIKTYVAVDGGMPDNPRPILYQAEYESVVANKAASKANKTVSVVGKCCESGDVLIEKTELAEDLESGDILCVFTTGAYNYSMASNYNRIPRPAMVMLKDGKARLSVRRETWEDLILREI